MPRTNITEVYFNGQTTAASEINWQRDYGQILKFPDLNLPFAYEVDFSADDDDHTITQIGDADGVKIPDQFFVSANIVHAYVYLHSGLEDGETTNHAVLALHKRPARSHEEPTPEEQSEITQAIAALDAAVAQTAQDVIDATAAKNAAELAQGKAEDAQAAAELAQGKAEDAQSAAETAQGKAEDAQEGAETAQGKAEDAQEAAEGSAEDSEAWANGTRNGVPVSSGDPAYQNNSHYWEELSRQNAEDAGWTFFDIDDETGELIVIVSDSLVDDVSFEINEETGELEVIVA